MKAAFMSCHEAQELFGANFIEPGTVSDSLHVEQARIDLKKLARIPYPRTVLELCNSGHILFPMPALCLQDLESCCPERVIKGNWYKDHEFAKLQHGPRWYLTNRFEYKRRASRRSQVASGAYECLPAVVALAIIILDSVLADRPLDCGTVICADEPMLFMRTTVRYFSELYFVDNTSYTKEQANRHCAYYEALAVRPN